MGNLPVALGRLTNYYNPRTGGILQLQCFQNINYAGQPFKGGKEKTGWVLDSG